MEDNSSPLKGMYSDWFLEYASYVILERAVPHINDGLKPVQRRILHSLKEKDDGRFNKVANIIGHTMQYHPHGDQSIGDALVNMGQKEIVVETQGNWGNITDRNSLFQGLLIGASVLLGLRGCKMEKVQNGNRTIFRVKRK